MFKKTKFESSHPTTHKITGMIAVMIAVDFLPFSIVENWGFPRLLEELKPLYQIPSRKYFTKTAIPELYKKFQSCVSRLLSTAAGPICGTTDIWTSIQNVAYMSLAAHFLSWDKGDLKRLSFVLACAELEEDSHTADAILREIRRVEAQWGINCFTMTSDNAANVVRALKDGNINNVRCMAHTVNLVVQFSLLNRQRVVCDTISRSRAIVKHYHKSAKDTKRYKDYLESRGKPVLKLIGDVSTRWNSTYHLLDRLVQQKEAINHLANNEGIAQTLSYNEWQIATSLVAVLKIFDTATLQLSHQNTTLAHILPIRNSLLKSLEQFQSDVNDGGLYGIGSFVDTFKEQIMLRFPISVKTTRESYFRDETIFEFCVIASAMDSRMKPSSIANDWDVDVVSLIKKAHFEILEDEETSPAEAESHSESASSDEGTKSILDSLFEPVAAQTQETSSLSSANEIRNSIKHYFGSCRSKTSKCQLEYWADQKHTNPELFAIALKFLTVPPNSVCSERLFSSTGIILSPLRNRLKAKQVEMLAFIHYNLPKLNVHC
ncbi:zinc finger BED domain-containing protein 4-like [Ciona intestinalis]